MKKLKTSQGLDQSLLISALRLLSEQFIGNGNALWKLIRAYSSNSVNNAVGIKTVSRLGSSPMDTLPLKLL